MAFEQEMKLISRGVEEIITREELEAKFAKSVKTGRPLRVKYGIDPTGCDVHLGHLVPIRKMRQFQDLGHIGVIIIGDFTAQIGDPTGRDESRPPLTSEQVIKNSEKFMEQLYTVLKPEKTEVRYQSEWFGKMGMSEVIKLMSKFTLAQFMAHETFRQRYEQGLSLGMHEILYPVLQGYDSVAIESDIELGATEQKFNILCGRDMQRHFGMEQQVAILSPILIGTDGVQKMGKSLNNYIAIFDSPKDKYGKVMSIPDDLILNYYCYATAVPEEEIDKIKLELESGINPMLIKKRLAREIVSLYHSAAETKEAEEAFEKQFSMREIPDDIPEFIIGESEYKLSKLLVDSKIFATNGEAKRLIQGGAVSVNGNKITAFDAIISLQEGDVIKAGKRNYIKIKKI